MATLKIQIEVTITDVKDSVISSWNHETAQQIKRSIENSGMGDATLAGALYELGAWADSEVVALRLTQDINVRTPE